MDGLLAHFNDHSNPPDSDWSRLRSKLASAEDSLSIVQVPTNRSSNSSSQTALKLLSYRYYIILLAILEAASCREV